MSVCLDTRVIEHFGLGIIVHHGHFLLIGKKEMVNWVYSIEVMVCSENNACVILLMTV
jgi:hypothetical protein